VPADIVVSNVDAQVLYRDLLPNPRRLTTLDDRSLAGFVLLLGVRGRTPGLAHHTVLFPGGSAADDRRAEPIARPGIEGSPRRNVRAGQDAYDAEFDAVFGDPGRGIPARPAPDPTVFVSVADDPSVRPEGYESWFVLVNAARQGRTLSSVDWTRPGLAEAYADRVLEVLAGRGLDIRDRLVFREIRTPADLGRSAAAPGGAIYGTAGHGLLRPANRGPVRGLFLVGGSAHPGGGLPLVALSAEIVAASI
jgi:phytoene dehydrogenase-like protein